MIYNGNKLKKNFKYKYIFCFLSKRDYDGLSDKLLNLINGRLSDSLSPTGNHLQRIFFVS